MRREIKLNNEQILAIETALSNDRRVELIPTKNGVMIFGNIRKQINIAKS